MCICYARYSFFFATSKETHWRSYYCRTMENGRIYVTLRKSDWSTEDHCGCDEMRIKYLHEKEQLEDLIEQYTKDLHSKK